jgi:hypothetical protein
MNKWHKRYGWLIGTICVLYTAFCLYRHGMCIWHVTRASSWIYLPVCSNRASHVAAVRIVQYDSIRSLFCNCLFRSRIVYCCKLSVGGVLFDIAFLKISMHNFSSCSSQWCHTETIRFSNFVAYANWCIQTVYRREMST